MISDPSSMTMWIVMGLLILLIVGVITGIVLFVKKKKLSAGKSIGLGFLIFTGLGAVIFAIVMGVNGFNSWYDSQKTDYRVHDTIYQWVDATPYAFPEFYVNPAEAVTKGKTLVPLQGIPISFQTSEGYIAKDIKETLGKLISSSEGTFDSGNMSIPRKSFPSAINITQGEVQYILFTNGRVINNGPLIIIMVKQ